MRVLLASKQARECTALRRVLERDPELNVVGTVTRIQELLAQVERNNPDLVLLDWSLPGLHTSDLLSALHNLPHPPRVVAFTEGSRVPQKPPAVRVHAFVSKEEPLEWLLSVLYTVCGLSRCQAA